MHDELQELRDRVEHLERELELVRATVARCVRKRVRNHVPGDAALRHCFGTRSGRRGTARACTGRDRRGRHRDRSAGLRWPGAGLIAIGGCAIGGICFGGCAFGVLLGVGGLATGALALGGLAIGWVAGGGMAVGHYACGGGAIGEHLFSAERQDPEAVEFFRRWVPWFDAWAGRRFGR